MSMWQVKSLEVALRVAAAVSALFAALWVLGVNGFMILGYGAVPERLRPLAESVGLEWTGRPTAPAYFVEPSDVERFFEFFQDLNGMPDGGFLQPKGWGEISAGTQVQLWDPTVVQQVLHVGVHVGIYLATAWIWWTLASLVAAGRSGTPFTVKNAGRLRAIGWVVLLGGTLAALAEWATLSWMLDTSSVADRMDGPGFGLAYVPWWTVGVGASVLVLAAIWRRGVIMQDDLDGLV